MTEQAQGQTTAETADTQAKPEAQPEAAESGRTYTHSEYQTALKKVGSQEKKEGRTSAINKLLETTGAESEDDLVSGYSEYLEIKEAVTSEADKANQRAEKAEAKEKEWQERYYAEKRGNAILGALRDAGANPEYLGTLLRIANLEALEVDKEGNVSGVEEEIERIREEAAPFFGSQERPRINAPQTTGMGVAGSAASPGSAGQTPEEQHAQWLVNLLGQ